MFSTGTIHWSTPQDFFDKVNRKYKFTLDACADTTNYKVKNYFTAKDNGLAQSWQNNVVWCNPPYGKTISDWVKKASDECSAKCTIVMLLPARTDTRWFHDYIYGNENCRIQFIKGRLKFSNSKSSAPFPSMLVEFKHICTRRDFKAADLSFEKAKLLNYAIKKSESSDAAGRFLSAFYNQIEIDGRVDIEFDDNTTKAEREFWELEEKNRLALEL